MVVYYGLYEIAPYSDGIQEFKIPFANLKDKLKFNF
ncbi:MAG: RsiV family protein [Caloramator sp.]|nr:RsiV family protein [Caloramator sp.]